MQALSQKRYGDRELCRRAARVGTWRRNRGIGAGDALQACCTCRDVDEEEQRYRSSGDALQACGLCRDVEAQRYRSSGDVLQQ